MYWISLQITNYVLWWEARVAKNPLGWEIAIFVVCALVTVMPAFVGVWGLVLYPIGWVYLLPALFAAVRVRRKRQDAELNKQGALKAALKTKELIRNGRKETRK